MGQAFAWPFFLARHLIAARIPHQSPVPLPYHHDLRCCGGESGERPHCAESEPARTPPNEGYQERCNWVKIASWVATPFSVDCMVPRYF